MTALTTFSLSAYPLVARDQAKEAVDVARTVLLTSWQRYQPQAGVTLRSLPAPFGFQTQRLTVTFVAEEPNDEMALQEAAKMLTLLQQGRPTDAWLLLGATSYANHPFLARHAGGRLVLPVAMTEPLSTTHKKALQPQKVTLAVQDSKRRTRPDNYMHPDKREDRMDFLAFSQWAPAMDFAQPYFRAIALDQAWRTLGPTAAACPPQERL